MKSKANKKSYKKKSSARPKRPASKKSAPKKAAKKAPGSGKKSSGKKQILPKEWLEASERLLNVTIAQILGLRKLGSDPQKLQVVVFDRSVHDAMTERGIK